MPQTAGFAVHQRNVAFVVSAVEEGVKLG